MSAPLEASRLTVKAASALPVDASGEIRTSRPDTPAAGLLSPRPRAQETIVALSGAIARRPLRPDEKKTAAGQISLACHEAAEKNEGVRLDQCHALDAGHVKGLRAALQPAAGRPSRAVSGAARNVIEPVLSEAAVVRTVRAPEAAARGLPA